jgi:uncharacterized membrane protein
LSVLISGIIIIDKLNEEGEALTVSNITVLTGVGNKYGKQVVEEIERVLGELGEEVVRCKKAGAFTGCIR